MSQQLKVISLISTTAGRSEIVAMGMGLTWARACGDFNTTLRAYATELGMEGGGPTDAAELYLKFALPYDIDGRSAQMRHQLRAEAVSQFGDSHWSYDFRSHNV